MIKKNIIYYLLMISCSNVVLLHGDFSAWCTSLLKDGTLLSIAVQSASIVATLNQLPSGKKFLGLTEQEILSNEAQRSQIQNSTVQLIIQLRQLFNNNTYFKNLSAYDQYVVYQLNLRSAAINHNTFMIKK